MAARNTLRLYIAADGTPAIRSFEEVGRASGLTADKVESSSEREVESMHRVEEASIRLEERAGKLKERFASIAETVGLAGAAFGIADVVRAGQRWQVQQAQLQTALRATGQASAASLASVTKATEGLATHGGYGVPEQLQGFNQLLRLTRSASAAMRDNTIATAMARSGATTFSNAQNLIERALSGSTRGLQKYIGYVQPVETAQYKLRQSHGFLLDRMQQESLALGKLSGTWLKYQDTLHNITPAQALHAQLLDKQATAQKVLAALATKYPKSIIAAYQHTTSGKISDAEQGIDIAIEKIGKTLLPAVARVGQALASLAMYVSDHWKQISHTIGAVVGPVIGAIRSVVLWFAHTKGAAVALGAGVATLVGALTLFKAALMLRSLIKDVSLGIDLLTAVIDGNITAWTALDVVMDTNVFALIAIGIAAVAAGLVFAYEKSATFRAIVQDIGRVAVSVASWIGQHWKLLAYTLGGPFIAAGVFIGTHLTQIVHLITGFAREVGKIFKGIFDVLVWPFETAYKVISKIVDLVGDKKLNHSQRSAVNRNYQSAGNGRFGFGVATGHHLGGIIRPNGFDTGGLIGGYGGGDQIPAYLEAGEGVLRKEAVRSIGVQAFNTINETGHIPASASNEAWVTMPIQLLAPTGEVLTQTVVKTAAKRGALMGNYVSG